MKTQVRKNILTNKWEVQAKENAKDRWQKIAEYATQEEAKKRAETLLKGKSGKLPKAQKKSTQSAKKTAKKGKEQSKEQNK